MKEATLKLNLTVRYDLHEENAEEMRDRLHRMVDSAIQNGMLTGSTSAEVEEYSYNVEQKKD